LRAVGEQQALGQINRILRSWCIGAKNS
jgi:hypothetical protein